MPYRLHDDLSFCRVDDGLIFLDVGHDRYFRLPPHLERALINYLEQDAASDITPLVERQILTDAAAQPGHEPVSALPVPTRSAIERPIQLHGTRILAALEVLVIVSTVRRQLKQRPLKDVLAALMAARHRGRPQPPEEDEARLIETIDTFRRARPYVPIEPVCLLDSIALTHFLARRGLRVHIVFGVTAEPFSAHCWVQAADMVLNDTVGHATSYTQIRVF